MNKHRRLMAMILAVAATVTTSAPSREFGTLPSSLGAREMGISLLSEKNKPNIEMVMVTLSSRGTLHWQGKHYLIERPILIGPEDIEDVRLVSNEPSPYLRLSISQVAARRMEKRMEGRADLHLATVVGGCIFSVARLHASLGTRVILPLETLPLPDREQLIDRVTAPAFASSPDTCDGKSISTQRGRRTRN